LRLLIRRSKRSSSADSQIETPLSLIRARGQNLWATVEQARDHARFAAAECSLAMAGEDVGNAHARRLFDLGIGIDERNTKPGAEPAADRRFANTHHADEHD
jgi:ribosomal protein L13E